MQFPPPNARKVYIYSVSPPWGHMDALGHINNTQYFGYCEEARIKWLGEIGYLGAIDGQSETGPVIINASCTFLKQIVYPCTLLVHLYVGDPGTSSLMTWYEIKGTDNTLYATGDSKMVWINYRAEKSTPLPDYLREAITHGECGHSSAHPSLLTD